MNTLFYRTLMCAVCFLGMPASSRGVVIVIHGTFATEERWCKPGGDFYRLLEQKAREQGHAIVPFSWGGGLSHSSRLNAGKTLSRLILSYPPQEKKIIIAHSFGGSALALASQMLFDPLRHITEELDTEKLLLDLKTLVAETYKTLCLGTPSVTQTRSLSKQENKKEIYREILKGYFEIHCALAAYNKNHMTRSAASSNPYLISQAYFLGTPTHAYYTPEMTVIEHAFNIYSNGDFIQPVFGLYQRTFPVHERITNIEITFERKGFLGRYPTHSELHSDTIAAWILDIPFRLKEKKINKFDYFCEGRNSSIHFDETKTPHFTVHAS